MTPAVDIRHLTVAYGPTTVLTDVSLTVPAGVAMAIVGPNGAGKSTLIKAMLGLIPTKSGQVLIHGQAYSRNRLAVAYVPQRTSVDWDFPTTVFDVVLMGTYGRLSWFRRPGRAEKQLTHDALERLGLTALANRQIGELSGGQQQRTFLARSLVQDAPVLVLDEPLQGVDATTEQTIVELLHGLRAQGRTIICVHHDLGTASTYFDQATLLNGQVIATGPSREVLTTERLKQAYGRTVLM
jgi:manganese/zinc/iron transport system ATP- binding protein